MKYREMLAELKRLGCTPARVKGSTSHKVWKTPQGATISLSVKHLNDDLPTGLLQKLRRQLAAEQLLLDK